MQKKLTTEFYYKQNRLQQLRGFYYTYRYTSISKAALFLGLTHSTVSVQIKSLEEDLGITLFERHGPKIVPTKDAKILYDISAEHIEGIDNIVDTFAITRDKEAVNRLDMAGTNSVINFVYPRILKRYLRTHPHTDVNVHFMEHFESLKAIVDGRIDLLMLPRRQHLPFGDEVEYHPMFYYDPVLISLPNHPLAGRKDLTVQDIAKYDFTLPDPQMYVIPGLHDIFKNYQIDKKFRINLRNWEVTKKYIEAGIAISITGDIVMEKNDKLVATSLNHLFPKVDYGFVFRKGTKIPSKVQPIIDIAQSFKGKPPLE